MSGYGQVAHSKVGLITSDRKIRKERPMKKTLKQKFKEWLFDSEEESRAVNEISINEDVLESNRCLKFKVFNANGGRVIETYFYDHRKDRNQQSLYVITSDQDFGHEIDKIITMETLKQ